MAVIKESIITKCNFKKIKRKSLKKKLKTKVSETDEFLEGI